jgi:hypothetical protein
MGSICFQVEIFLTLMEILTTTTVSLQNLMKIKGVFCKKEVQNYEFLSFALMIYYCQCLSDHSGLKMPSTHEVGFSIFKVIITIQDTLSWQPQSYRRAYQAWSLFLYLLKLVFFLVSPQAGAGTMTMPGTSLFLRLERL